MDSNIKYANSKISQELTKRQCREHKINKTCSNYCTFFVSTGLFPNVKPFLLSNHFISTNFSSNCSRSNWKIKGISHFISTFMTSHELKKHKNEERQLMLSTPDHLTF